MTARISEADARRLGLTAPTKRSKRTTKGSGRAGATSRCHDCELEFTSDAAEGRHLADTGHARYESVTT